MSLIILRELIGSKDSGICNKPSFRMKTSNLTPQFPVDHECDHPQNSSCHESSRITMLLRGLDHVKVECC